jgi:hypothetical protein
MTATSRFAPLVGGASTTVASALNPVERLVAGVCLVYPFRIFLNEITHVDFHIGLVSFALLVGCVLVTVRELPTGFPTALDAAVIVFAEIAAANFWLLTGPTSLATKGFSVEGRFIAFYFLARLLGLRREFLSWLCVALAAIGIAEAVVGALEYHLGWGTLLRLCGRPWTASFWKMGLPRLYSFAMDPLSAGYILVLALAGCIYLTRVDRRLFAALGVLAIWQALPLTLARVPVTFAVGMTIVFAILDRRCGVWFAKLSFVAIAAAAAVYLSRGWNEPLIEYAAVGGMLGDTSAAVHQSALERGIALMLQWPLGIGLGEAGLVAIWGGGGFRANETYYVTIGVQLGFPGLIAFVAAIATAGVVWLRLLRASSIETSAIGGMGFAIWLLMLSGGVFSGSWNMLVAQFYFWVLTGAAANCAASMKVRAR